MKRWVIGLVVFIILVLGLLAGAILSLGYYLSPQSDLVKADVIVAISGGETEARTKEAVKLYQDGWAPKLIFSGAASDPNSPSNARTMAQAAEQAGVPAGDILLDETSVDTRNNAKNVASIMATEGFKSAILVTSPYHQRRALINFQRALGPKFTIINHSSYDQAWRRAAWWQTPYSRALTMSELQKVIYEQLVGGR